MSVPAGKLALPELAEMKAFFLKFGDRVRIEMLDEHGHGIFGAIDQVVARA